MPADWSCSKRVPCKAGSSPAHNRTTEPWSSGIGYAEAILSLLLHGEAFAQKACRPTVRRDRQLERKCTMTLPRALWRRMRLFDRLARIQLRMSATSICAALAGPTAAAALTGSASLLFSTFMADDTKSLALGLRRRDPEVLDALIEQYQYRLFRYLVYITGNRERAEDFFQETWIRVLERGHQYHGKSSFDAWLFSIAPPLLNERR